jgi:hypothetical protein
LSGIAAANRWLTISGAPGTDVDDVVFTGGSGNGLSNGLLHIRNIKMQGPDLEFGGSGGFWGEGVVSWGVDAGSDGGGISTNNGSKPQGVFITESTCAHLHQPIVKATLQRNLTMIDIGQDLFREPRTVINVNSIDHGAAVSHSDFVQWYMPDVETAENFIMYNIVSHDAHSITQGIYHDGSGGDTPYFHNAAFVNIHIDRTSSSSSRSQWIDTESNHLLFWHVTHDNISMYLGSASDVTNLSVRGCCWEKFTVPPGTFDPNDFANNHYEIGSGYQVFAGGINATTGDPGWNNPAANDYTPGPGSVLLDRVNPLISPVDAVGEVRNAPASSGAFEP